MTVDELLKRLAHSYSAFTAERVEHWGPVFRARFGHREGPKLEDAFTEVLATFQPKNTKPFPIPIDFEAHMPSLKNIKSAETPIRPLLEERHLRAQRLFDIWHSSQGLKIKGARPYPVYASCMLEAYARAKAARTDADFVRLSVEDIARCEQRAVTCERVHRFGALPRLPDVWEAQCAEIRADWAA